MFPNDPKKLKATILRYRRTLLTDRHDGYGKRFVVGPMYLLLGDTEGALDYYGWYESAFPEDGGEPFNHLAWTLALYSGGHQQRAERKLRETVFENLYIVPVLLGENPKPHAIWHSSNWTELSYVTEGPQQLLSLWGDEARTWAKRVYAGAELSKDRIRFIEIGRELISERPGERRSALVGESIRLRTKSQLRLV